MNGKESDTLVRDHCTNVLERRNEAFRILYDTVIEVEGLHDEQLIYSILCQKLCQICKAQYAALAGYYPQSRTLCLRAISRDCREDPVLKDLTEKPTTVIDSPTEHVLKKHSVRLCDEHDISLENLFPEHITTRQANKRRGSRYRLAFVREEELNAIGTIQMAPGSKLKLKDLVGTYLNVVSMILQRINALRDLSESEDYLKTLLDSIHSGVLVVDYNSHTILDCNVYAAQLLKRPREDIVGKACHGYICEAPEGQCPVSDLQQGLDLSERNLMLSDGSCRAVLKSAIPLERHGRRLIIESFADIEELKQTRENLRKLNTYLQQANRDLKQAQAQTIQSEKLASIGQLAAGVAHEINNPVGFVAGNFQALENYMKKIQKLLNMHNKLTQHVEALENPDLQTEIKSLIQFRKDMQIDFILEDIQRLFEESKEGLERTTDIVQNLRDFSRIDQPGSRDEYNLNEGIKSTLVVARNEIKYNANVETDLAELPKIFCHSGQINQVLLNILVNASQAIKSQERDDRGTITIRTYGYEGGAVCEISDDGPGIPEDKVSKVFDPFFTTKPAGKGTGLGLSVSYDIIVNKHSGEFFVDSMVGEGTKFTIKLPICTKENGEEKEDIESCE